MSDCIKRKLSQEEIDEVTLCLENCGCHCHTDLDVMHFVECCSFCEWGIPAKDSTTSLSEIQLKEKVDFEKDRHNRNQQARAYLKIRCELTDVLLNHPTLKSVLEKPNKQILIVIKQYSDGEFDIDECLLKLEECYES